MNQNTVNLGMSLSAALEATGQKCFLCFGTLLFFVRDRKFEIDDSDIDIGIIGSPAQAMQGLSSMFQCTHEIIDNATGLPYCATFQWPHGNVSIDVFFWRKKNGMYWHTFDHKMINPADGVLPEYEFKGIPADCFDVAPETVSFFQNDLRYGRDMGSDGTWRHLIPGIETEGISLPLPFGYGKALDYWYPDWYMKRETFGVSECPQRFTLKNYEGCRWEA